MNMNKQKGATLLLALIILAGMTVFGVTSMRNTATQQNILRNTQLKKATENTAFTEIKAQIEHIEYIDDELIRTIIDMEIDNETNIKDIPTDQGGGLKSTKNGFEQTVIIVKTEDHKATNFRLEGEEVDRAGISVRAEIRSTAQLKNSHTESSQTQGIEYLLGAST